ncbi:MAG TPA: hypothetical protein VLC48_05170 [Gemmatimonadota bacterium]|nr:hypothetical protein [Gemmatimonadota bacterium]
MGMDETARSETAKQYGLPESVECPFCGGSETHLETPFGSVLSVAQYYCRRCKTIFEWIKRNR